MSAKTHQLVGMGDRQISQHHTVQQRKNRRIRANGKGKDDKRHNEGTRRLAQQAQTKVQILNEILNPIYASLRDHLQQKTEEYLAQGLTQEGAHRRARLDLGGIEQTKEKCRDARRVT